MKSFLVSCGVVLAIGLVSYGVFGGLLSQSAAEAYSVDRAVRIQVDAWPAPDGELSHLREPTGGIESGRSPAGDVE
ncbi:hypothetical protein [Salinarimonas ramus]|uniref:Uncharacterized protein n=1 Tax=Salinarimonas ramus TaxID=690164 RepID=A0A917QDE6_9HYPH|nr:hypothetical protein [Salinarimonas ramus]GGK45250.1 hypothetical protein GCM10011322_35520 [Salinarimonas ramus]